MSVLLVISNCSIPSINAANDTQDYQSTYAKGGIHINPANKGKFNALKARTGKTTEELTHSKNPLTRKRAIFAQNAKNGIMQKVVYNQIIQMLN